MKMSATTRELGEPMGVLVNKKVVEVRHFFTTGNWSEKLSSLDKRSLIIVIKQGIGIET